MHKVKTSGKVVDAVNVLIFAKDRDILWDYRNLLNDIEEKVALKIRMTLTGSACTVFELAEFFQGGLDIYLSNNECGEEEEQFLEEKIKKKYPACHCIRRKKEEYIYTHRTKYGIWHVQHLVMEEERLEELFLHVLSNLTEESCAS